MNHVAMLHRRSHGLILSAGSRLFYQSSRILVRHQSSNVPPPTHNIAVLGGGISGLATAYYLIRELPGAQIRIYESANRLGGWVDSKRVPVDNGSIIFESAVRSLRPAKNGVLTAYMIEDLDLAKETIFTQQNSSAARERYIYYPDHLVRMPHPTFGLADNLWSMLTEPVFSTALWSGITEFSRNPRDSTIKDESVGEFLSRRLSKTVVDRLVSAVMHGIYAGDIWKLSAKSLLSTQWRDEINAGSVVRGMIQSRAEGGAITQRDADMIKAMQEGSLFKDNMGSRLARTFQQNSVFTFRDGVQTLTDRLAKRLFESGQVEFWTNTPVQAIELSSDKAGVDVRCEGDNPGVYKHTHVISALPPEKLNSIARSTSGSISSSNDRMIPAIPNVTVMTVNLYYKRNLGAESGFGYLIPLATPFENNPERALGVVFDNSYSPSPAQFNMSNWDFNEEVMQKATEGTHLIDADGFSWYNMPDKLVRQDDVESRGTKVTVMLGGHWWDGWPAYPDEKEGLALAKSLLERHLGYKDEPLVWQVNLEKDCIPQYTVGHEQRLKQAHENLWREYKGKVRVVGNWIDGVGFNDCVRTAYEVAKNFGKAATGLEHIGEEPTLRAVVNKS